MHPLVWWACTYWGLQWTCNSTSTSTESHNSIISVLVVTVTTASTLEIDLWFSIHALVLLQVHSNPQYIWVYLIYGMDWWNGLIEWTDGMDRWNGISANQTCQTRHHGHGEVVSAVSTITSTITVRETTALLFGRLCLIFNSLCYSNMPPFRFCVLYCQCKPEKKKQGRPGNYWGYSVLLYLMYSS